MRFLDVAEVSSTVGLYGGEQGEYSRACGGFVQLLDACGPSGDTGVDVIGDDTSEVNTYVTMPFAVVSALRTAVKCSKPDDAAWLEKALQASQEFVLSHAMLVQPIDGTESWVGDPAVTEVPLATGATQDALVAAIAEARDIWFTTVLTHDGQVIMHVAPAIAPALVRAGVLFISNPSGPSGRNGANSIWGDDVVIAPGYNLDSPQVFFTGPIGVKLSSVDTSGGLLVDARSNRTYTQANQIAEIDVNPCSIVRVGAMSTARTRTVEERQVPAEV